MTVQYPHQKKPNRLAAPFNAEEDVAEPPSATGQYPDPVWANGSNGATAQSLSRRGRTPRFSRPFSSEIPLDPGTGGQSIGLDALQMGDIILSTTDEFISDAIRNFTNSPVSHAMIYTGDGGQVVEAIAEGVVFRPLAEAIAGASFAVAFRHPFLTEELAWRVRHFAGEQIGKLYNYWGIVQHARFRVNTAACSRFRSEEACRDFFGKINLGTSDNETFFCSELVLAAYQDVGVPLTSTPPNWNAPSEIAELRMTGMLEYVGHLKTPGISMSQAQRANTKSFGNGRQPMPRYARPLEIVRPDYVPANAIEALQFMWEWLKRGVSWAAGVPDTGFFPHSAICHLDMHFDDNSDSTGTGFYIAPDCILTAAHNVVDMENGSIVHRATSVSVTPGKNGANTAPFGSFNAVNWQYHPSYDGNNDFDLAVIKVNQTAPNGLYFNVLEELNQSIMDTIIVCGYAGVDVDPDKQHLDGDTIRTLSDNGHLFQYNLHTQEGSSGSPVYYITAYDDPVRQMSVLEIRVIGVHVAPFDNKLNEGCRLTQDKINWIYSACNSGAAATQALSQHQYRSKYKTVGVKGAGANVVVPRNGQGRTSSPARSMRARTARPLQGGEIAAEIAGAVVTRILDNEGDISWELDQLSGLKHPDNNPANAGSAQYSTMTITVPGPRGSTVLGQDEIYADSEITFQYNGHSVGNVETVVTRANDAFGAGLAVKVNIMDDANTYTRPPSTERFAAIKVRFHYRFTTMVQNDGIAITDLVLYGDGNFDQRFRWTQ